MPVKPPVCPVCEHPHWLADPHVWDGKPAGERKVTLSGNRVVDRERKPLPPVTTGAALQAALLATAGPNPSPKIKALDAEATKLRAEISREESRRDYMRAYMAKRRAEAKK